MGIGSTDTCTFTWCLFFVFLKEGLSTIAYVREGKNISMTCPTSNNVYTWIKLPSFTILADCNEEMPLISAGVFVTDDCKNLVINNLQINDESTYRCISGIGQNKTQHNVTLKTKSPPVVQNMKVIFRINNSSRILKCNASGEPEIYTFSAWQHHTYNNDWIRDLHGDANGNLILPDTPTRKDHWYEDSGVYTCNVTNGVSDESDNLWQNGKITVIVEDKPVLVYPKTRLFYGDFNKTSTISIFVLSSSNISTAKWFNSSKDLLANKTCASSEAETEFHRQLFNVSGYKCEILLPPIKNKDFQTYTVEISNQFGGSIFEVSLKSKRALDEPPNTTDDIKVSGMRYIFGFILAIIIPGCLLVIWCRLKKAKKKDSHSDARENDQHESAGAIVNNLYGSTSDLDASPSTSGVRTDVYSSINRREQMLDKQNVTYNIDGEGERSQTELTDAKQWKTNIATGSSTLNYVEVEFGREQSKGNYLIHGADNRTPYADIDFLAKAEPLISSDENDEGSNSGINIEDDFMSLEDVQQWNITAD